MSPQTVESQPVKDKDPHAEVTDEAALQEMTGHERQIHPVTVHTRQSSCRSIESGLLGMDQSQSLRASYLLRRRPFLIESHLQGTLKLLLLCALTNTV